MPSTRSSCAWIARSLGSIRRWLKNTWLSRLPLSWKEDFLAESEARKKKLSPRLQLEQLEARAVCMNVLGAVQSVGLGMGLAALAGPLPTPTDVVMKGWNAYQPSLPPEVNSEPSSKKKTSKSYDREGEHQARARSAVFARYDALPTEPIKKASQEEKSSEKLDPNPPAEIDAKGEEWVALLDGDLQDDWLNRVGEALEEEPQPRGNSAPAFGGLGDGTTNLGASVTTPPQTLTPTGGSPGTSAFPQPNTSVNPFGLLPSTTSSSTGPGSSTLLNAPLSGSDSTSPQATSSATGTNEGEPRTAAGAAGSSGPALQEGGASEIAPTISDVFANRRLPFELNTGQTDASVQFLSRGQGYQIFLQSDEMVLSLTKEREPTEAELLEHPEWVGREVRLRDVVSVQLEGADSTTPLIGHSQLKSRSNYFIGQERDLALTDIPHYGEVLGQDVYDGIDVRYQGDGRKLRFDLEVKPGADLSQIRLRYEGVAAPSIDVEGQLNLLLPNGESVVQRAPVIYQENRSTGQREYRTGRYVLNQDQTVSFEVDSFDATRKLIIDPTLDYGTYRGGSGNDEGTSVCAQYTMGNMAAAACQVETSYTDTNNRSNNSETRTYSANYALGGGVTIGAVYFDVEQTANSLKRTDVDGVMTKLSVGF